MNSNIQIINFGTPLHDELVELRNQILRVPLGLEFTINDLEKEYNEIHFGYLNSKCILLGCLQLRIIDSDILKMRQVCVIASQENKGIGKLLVKASESYATEKGFSKIELHARENAIPFYLKQNYKKVGRSFKEVGILHYKMEKKLS